MYKTMFQTLVCKLKNIAFICWCACWLWCVPLENKNYKKNKNKIVRACLWILNKIWKVVQNRQAVHAVEVVEEGPELAPSVRCEMRNLPNRTRRSVPPTGCRHRHRPRTKCQVSMEREWMYRWTENLDVFVTVTNQKLRVWAYLRYNFRRVI